MRGISIFIMMVSLVLGLINSNYAELIDRGGGMIYSTDLDITWLKDANYAKTSGYDDDGLMTWNEAIEWVETLNYGGYDGWRLPTFDPDNPSPCYVSTLHEMRYLLYTELGNDCRSSGYDYGPFVNVMPGYPVDYIEWYWSGTDFDRFNAWRFSLESGLGETHNKDVGFHAWAVRDGDVNPFCQGNFDFDDDVDGSDAYTFKQHFGRSVFRSPCPTDGPAPVERTWQTDCFAAGGSLVSCPGSGQDGDWQKGIVWPDPRFTDNGDGTVTDNLTGLIWLKNANCFGVRMWEEALTDCNNLASGQCGLTDGSETGSWRLPNIKELISLIDYGNFQPALPTGHPFTNVPVGDYWSSSNYFWEGLALSAWTVHASSGFLGVEEKDYPLGNDHVWPVRGGR